MGGGGGVKPQSIREGVQSQGNIAPARARGAYQVFTCAVTPRRVVCAARRLSLVEGLFRGR